MTTPAIAATGLRKTFKDKTVLDGLRADGRHGPRGRATFTKRA
jgi:hypothetical protein